MGGCTQVPTELTHLHVHAACCRRYSYKTLDDMGCLGQGYMEMEDTSLQNSLKLVEIARLASDCSGRSLRKLPFLACTRIGPQLSTVGMVSADTFMDALLQATHKSLADKAMLGHGPAC